MNIPVKIARQAIHDKIDSQIKTVEAKLDTLKARAATAKADIEITAITALLVELKVILQKLRELKKSGGTRVSRRKRVANRGL